VSAVVALVLPARPLGAGPEVERMRLRLGQAEDDRRRWAEEVRARGARVAACASAAGLPAGFDAAVLQRREAELAAGLDAREAVAAREQQRTVARNTASAARERVGSLRAQQRELRRRVEDRQVARAALQPTDTSDTSNTSNTSDSSDSSDSSDASGTSDEVVLQQERRGLLEALNRRRWELDRLTVTHWLLTEVAVECAADPSRADSSRADPSPADLGRGDAGTDLQAARRLVTSAGMSGHPAPDGAPPVLVRGLETWPDGVERAELVRLLTELSRSMQVLVLTPIGERPSQPAIRVLVTPAE
jgi:hypothetical protein